VLQGEQAVKTNRHPVDRLADVRHQIRELQEEEAELRAKIISDDDLVGDNWCATLTVTEREKLDTKAVLKKFGTDRLREFLTVSRVSYLRLKERCCGE
jgi:hypothetical protein